MPSIFPEDDHTVVRVLLTDREYDVVVGDNLLSQAAELVKDAGLTSKHCALVTDSNVGPLYSETVAESLTRAGIEVTEIRVPAGEASKSMTEVTHICRKMLQAGLDRKSFLIALGGGVVGDLAGFAAAVFQRGIPYVQMPTTIVSVVDSSVGGKTGVNTPEGKNLIGAFHQPELVLADMRALASLPEREYNEGFAEVIKHAAIRDEGLLNVIAEQGTSRHHLKQLVAANVAIKAEIVEEDERETRGVRSLLNFGHTIGHGIEAAAGYGEFLHGEAISLGLVAALRLSREIEGLPEADVDRVVSLLEQYQLPTRLTMDLSTEAILEAMRTDKKFEEGRIRFVLLRALGDAYLSDKVSLEAITQAIEGLRA